MADRLSGAVGMACDPAWRDALAAALPGPRVGGCYADGRMIDTVAAKRALDARTGALIVDMESQVAAAVAATRGLPLAIVRCVSDGAGHVLPPAITVSMRPDGGVNALAMLRSIAGQPGQIADLIASMVGFVRAMRALRRGAMRIGPHMVPPAA